MKWLRWTLGVFNALAILLPVQVLAAPLPSCSLCLAEVQTAGLSSESEDYVIISNQSSASIDLTGMILKYVSASGASSRTLALSGELASGAFAVYVASNLSDLNPTAHSLGTIGLSSTGGSLMLVKAVGGSVFDQVGWGTATVVEGQAAPAPTKGQSLRRIMGVGGLQDTNSNSGDFEAVAHTCSELALNEIQPFALDAVGSDLQPALEYLLTSDAEASRCPVNINDVVSYMTINTDLMRDGYLVIAGLYDDQNNEHGLGLLEAGNVVQPLQTSRYGEVIVPTPSVQQPGLESGRSYALFGTSWKPTYAVTIGAANQLATSPPDSAPEDHATVTDTPVFEEAIMPTLPLSITELFPNPAPPLTDENDEFIELYNPNDLAIDLSGYSLQSGANYTYTYVFTTGSIEAHSYKAFVSSQTDLSLSNSGGHARLVAPNGQTVSETDSYNQAAEGQSWALIDGSWRWTTQPTAGVENVLVAVVPPAATSKATSLKNSTSKTASKTSKPASAKAASSKTSSSTGGSGNKSSSNGVSPPPVHGLILAGVGLLAVGYAGYEYRTDMANYFQRLRRYRTNRRAARAASSGW